MLKLKNNNPIKGDDPVDYPFSSKFIIISSRYKKTGERVISVGGRFQLVTLNKEKRSILVSVSELNLKVRNKSFHKQQFLPHT